MSGQQESRLIDLVQADAQMMAALRAVRALDLPDGWISAGFVRNRVWDHLHGFARPTALNDVDVIYLDPDHVGEDPERGFEAALGARLPELPWQVRNQARMAGRNGDPPYRSIDEALAHWCETPTAIAVRIAENDRIEIRAPLGLDDLFDMTARPTPFARSNPRKLAEYRQRMATKNWPRIWPRVKVLSL